MFKMVKQTSVSHLGCLLTSLHTQLLIGLQKQAGHVVSLSLPFILKEAVTTFDQVAKHR